MAKKKSWPAGAPAEETAAVTEPVTDTGAEAVATLTDPAPFPTFATSPAPISGVILPLAADMDDANILHIRDGRRRLKAALAAGEEVVPVTVDGALHYLPPGDITIDPAMDSRAEETYSDESFTALVASIRAVRELRSQPLTPQTALMIAFHANNNSKPETTADYLKTLRLLKAQGMKNNEIAKLLVKSPAWVTQMTKLLTGVPEDIQPTIGEHISMEAALEVLKPETPQEKREAVFEQLRRREVVEDALVDEPATEPEAASAEPATGKKPRGKKGKKTKAGKIGKKDVTPTSTSTNLSLKQIREVLARNAGEVEALEKEDLVFGVVNKAYLALLDGKVGERAWKNRVKMNLKAK